jgi:hypothetical protein
MTDKIAIRTSYTYDQCGDGCCSWTTTIIESDDGRISFEQQYFLLYSMGDFIDWLNNYFREDNKNPDWWKEFYYIDEQNSTLFY